MKINISPEDEDIFDGFGNGSLHMCLVRDPKNWRGVEQTDGFYMELDFHGSDWDALFIDVLGFPGWDEYVEGDDVFELHERNRKKFERTIPEYPMLARIFDMYEDYQFAPDEVLELREECERVKLTTSNPGARKALRKLILASNEATKRGFHLVFSCD